MFPRDDQYVCRGLGIDIADDYAAIVLIDHISRRGARQDFAKEAIGLSHGRIITQSPEFKLRLS